MKYVVFKGGGVRIAAHIGVYAALEPKIDLQGAAGTSAGAIMACLVCLGYKASEIKSLMDQTDFSSFEDGNIIQDFKSIHRFGLHPGTFFQNWIEAKIRAKTGKAFSTFADLQANKIPELVVFATDLWTGLSQRFDWKHTPQIIVSEAIRASMSIPGIFEAFEFSSGTANGLVTGSQFTGHLFVDGGCTDNYPIDAFDEACGCPDKDVIGSFLYSIGGIIPLQYGQYGQWAKSTFGAIMNAQDVITMNNPSDMARSIQVDCSGYSATDFGIDQAGKDALYQSGLNTATSIL